MTTLIASDVVVTGRVRASLRLGTGVTVVVGKNGAGKSTLLDVLAGVRGVDGGHVSLDDGSRVVDVSTLSPRVRAQRMASLAQEPPGLADVVVRDRIAQGLVPRRGAWAGISDDVAGRIAAVADELGVGALLSRRLSELSGGERRRVHVARALIDDDAEVVIVDEPFAGLDQRSSALLVAALRRRGERQIVVVSVHDVALALALSGRLVGLHDGDVVVDGALPEALSQATAVWGDVKIVNDGDWVGVLVRHG